MAGDIFGGHNLGWGMLLPSSGQRFGLGVLLNVLHCAGWLLTPRNYWAPNINIAGVDTPWHRGGRKVSAPNSVLAGHYK